MSDSFYQTFSGFFHRIEILSFSAAQPNLAYTLLIKSLAGPDIFSILESSLELYIFKISWMPIKYYTMHNKYFGTIDILFYFWALLR